MISEGTKKFDLYDFFSVFLPGSYFILGLLPFLPNSLSISTSALVPLIIGGFVVGRGLHALAIVLEDRYSETLTHREEFISEMRDPSFLTPETVLQFRRECAKEFDGIDDPMELSGEESSESSLTDMYVLVRSYIHMDARGRSRSFQAIYSFYRSTWIASLILAILYYFYSLLKVFGWLQPIDLYTSFLGEINVPVTALSLGSVALVLAAHRLFGEARGDYQRYFIQYLIGDFLVLQNIDRPDSIVTARQFEKEE